MSLKPFHQAKLGGVCKVDAYHVTYRLQGHSPFDPNARHTINLFKLSDNRVGKPGRQRDTDSP